MYKGDRSRKETLVEYGFRLPSALDNRPLKFEEWEQLAPQMIFVSATPGKYEAAHAGADRRAGGAARRAWSIRKSKCVRWARRWTTCCRRSTSASSVNERVLITTLTKRMAEDLTEYLHEHDVRVRYLHSDIETVERTEIIRDLRLGKFDVLVGINLLREGLDMPEVSLVAILDADKEGFLRSDNSLIQTIGRAARNINGRAILYADSDHRLDAARDRRDQPPPRASRSNSTRSTASRRAASRRPWPTSWKARARAGARQPAGAGSGDGKGGEHELASGRPAPEATRPPDQEARGGDVQAGPQPGVRGGREAARRDRAAEADRAGAAGSAAG